MNSETRKWNADSCRGLLCRSLRAVLLTGWVLLAGHAAAKELTLITLDPGHFHAAMFQREMLPGIAVDAFIYAPLGPDLTAHLNRVAQFNLRTDQPTNWRLHVYTGPDFQERMLRERPGRIVVMSGRNRAKMDRILGCVKAGLHVLADKPWIIEPEDLPKLETALDTADARRVIGYDAMTQRFEITSIVPRVLVADADVFGKPISGSPDEPAVSIGSLHYLFKEVSGVPNLRPGWFFDIVEQGEGLTDVGTHLADIVPWVLFPDQAINYRSDIQVLRGKRWPTTLTLAEFQRVTGEKDFPDALKPQIKDGRLDYFCNNTVSYTLRGLHVRLEATWDFIAPVGKKDTELVVFRGSRARVEVRQGTEEHYQREVYVVPNAAADRRMVLAALNRRVAALQQDWPGVAVEEQAARFRVLIPDRFRISHEEHFALVARRFLDYVRNPRALPAWEKPNMLAKYYVTTQGVRLARQEPVLP
jgi:predicted dehydrogenase